MQVLTKWDRRFLDLAGLVASWSKDPRGGVGAVIVRPRNRIVSLGFNGFPLGFDDSRVDLYGKRWVVHAEENAIIFAQRDLAGCTAYTRPLPPCSSCSAKIMQVGITRLVAQWVPSRHSESEVVAFRQSLQQLEAAGVAVLSCEEC